MYKITHKIIYPNALRSWTINLRNWHNNSICKVMRKVTRKKNITHEIANIMTNHMPMFLVKNSLKTILTWCLVWVHGGHSISDFFIGHRKKKGLVTLSGNFWNILKHKARGKTSIRYLEQLFEKIISIISEQQAICAPNTINK